MKVRPRELPDVQTKVIAALGHLWPTPGRLWKTPTVVENSTCILQFSCGVIAIAQNSALINVTLNKVAGNIHLLNQLLHYKPLESDAIHC